MEYFSGVIDTVMYSIAVLALVCHLWVLRRRHKELKESIVELSNEVTCLKILVDSDKPCNCCKQ